MRTVLIASVLALAGCATPYQPHNLLGGYSEHQVNARAFEVSFAGNAYTSASYARDGAMRRAAELAILGGFAGFVVADSAADTSVSSWTEPVQCTGSAGNVNCTGGNTRTMVKPSAQMTVVMLKAEEAAAAMAAGRLVYDAGLVMGRGSLIPPPAPPLAPAAAQMPPAAALDPLPPPDPAD